MKWERKNPHFAINELGKINCEKVLLSHEMDEKMVISQKWHNKNVNLISFI